MIQCDKCKMWRNNYTECNCIYMFHMLDVCRQIGRVVGTNCSFAAGLAEKLEELGKPIEQLTVAELISEIDKYAEYFNAEFFSDQLINNPKVSDIFKAQAEDHERLEKIERKSVDEDSEHYRR